MSHKKKHHDNSKSKIQRTMTNLVETCKCPETEYMWGPFTMIRSYKYENLS